MKIRFGKNGVIVLLVCLQLVTLGLLVSKISALNSSRTINPPIAECIVKKGYVGNSGLIAHYPFEEMKDGKTVDASGNGYDGAEYGVINSKKAKKLLHRSTLLGIPQIVNGKHGNAVELYGKQWISGGNHVEYNTNTFTISVWVWREKDGDMVPTIMAKGSWPYFDGWWLCTKPYSKCIDMGIAWGETYTHVSSGYEMPLKEWHHIAVTMNNIDHRIQFFIDGQPYGKVHENVHPWIVNWNHNLFIGDFDGSGRWPWFGKIDEAYYFDRILTEQEVKALYNFEKV